ncbi:hypothetical protein Tco_0973776 [Tanacetum coccineum]|uniref:Uncharacterized protein n=1 Tax=Tanacetum coccineum TaxID=301880 RepID=A0ABQ5E9R7_9ASTR
MPTVTVAVSDVLRDGSRMHTHDHGGSEALDGSPDSILSSEPKPPRKHKLLLHHHSISWRESSYPLNSASSVTLVLTSHTVIGAISRTVSVGSTKVSLIPYPTSLIPYRLASASTSTGGGMYRDGGSGGSGGDGGAVCAHRKAFFFLRVVIREIGGDGDGAMFPQVGKQAHHSQLRRVGLEAKCSSSLLGPHPHHRVSSLDESSSSSSPSSPRSIGRRIQREVNGCSSARCFMLILNGSILKYIGSGTLSKDYCPCIEHRLTLYPRHVVLWGSWILRAWYVIGVVWGYRRIGVQVSNTMTRRNASSDYLLIGSPREDSAWLRIGFRRNVLDNTQMM